MNRPMSRVECTELEKQAEKVSVVSMDRAREPTARGVRCGGSGPASPQSAHGVAGGAGGAASASGRSRQLVAGKRLRRGGRQVQDEGQGPGRERDGRDVSIRGRQELEEPLCAGASGELESLKGGTRATKVG